jgi:hypothetical protein
MRVTSELRDIMIMSIIVSRVSHERSSTRYMKLGKMLLLT